MPTTIVISAGSPIGELAHKKKKSDKLDRFLSDTAKRMKKGEGDGGPGFTPPVAENDR